MPYVELPGGGFAIVCTRGRGGRPKPCFHSQRPSDLLCDYPTNRAGKTEMERTCSRPICKDCATKVGGADFCKPHAADWKERCP